MAYHREKLESFLVQFSLQLIDLPVLLMDLQAEAKAGMAVKICSTTELDVLKRNLQAIYIQLENTKIHVSTRAGIRIQK